MICYSGGVGGVASWGMHDYRKLDVWRKGRALVQAVYTGTSTYPRAETYGLVAQSRAAAVGIPANIAEGSGRGSQRDYARFVGFAIGSACELETLVILAQDLGFLTPEVGAALLEQTARVRRMLLGFQKSLRTTPEA